MRIARAPAAIVAVAALACGAALPTAPGWPAARAAPPDCRIAPFAGATLPQGAVATMRVVGDGGPCRIDNFGIPSDRRNPAESGSITTAPAHGKAEFAAPAALYTPEPGYVGDDAFAYEAYAKGNVDQRVRLKVRVQVTVFAR